MKCSACGKAKMIRETRDVKYTYKGHTKTISNVSGEFCPRCNESLHTEDEAEYLSSEMLAFTKSVNGAAVDPEFITKTRKKLKLDQRQAAELFGGGANAFSRYETGKTKPPLALLQLFKLLDKHPDLIKEIWVKQPDTASATIPKSRLAKGKKLSL